MWRPGGGYPGHAAHHHHVLSARLDTCRLPNCLYLGCHGIGFVCVHYQPAELAALFSDMLADPARLEAMGEAGRKHVQEHYTWEVAAKRIVARIHADLQRSGISPR